MPSDLRRYAPAVLRNKEVILEVLERVFPTNGSVLEIASGSGEHASYFSRAMPNLQWQPSEYDVEQLNSINAHAAFDEATAILAGDSLLTQAFEVVARDVKPAAVAARCVVALATAAGNQGMVGGQADDLDIESHQATVEFLEAIHRRKTGALLIAAVEMGAIVAQAEEDNIQRLRDYGYNLGLAFQVVDDLLDWTGDEALLGKRTNKDGDRGKLTYPGLLGVEASRRRAADLVDQACELVSPFGEGGRPLAAIAQYVLEREQ